MRSTKWSSSLLCVLLIVLAACGDAQNKTATPAHTKGVIKATPSATTPSPSGVAQKNEDWPAYHRDSLRTGYLPEEPDATQLNKTWAAILDGSVYAQPLVVGGHIIVATENDSIYSLDAASGSIIWHTNVGTPVSQSTLPCGDIDPLGITGTPVYDTASGLVFAVAEIEGPQHILVGIDLTTGNVRIKLLVDVPGMKPTKVYQQRAALALSQGMVYIAYGGLAGDCGQYRGTVVAVRTDGQGDLLSYQVPTTREAGIWAPSGPAIDDAGHVYVAVGNGEATSGDWDHSDSVLRLSKTLQLEDGFAPSQWQSENDNDTDLGSMGPTLLPGGLLFIAGKSGTGYTLHANALGGVGGQVAQAKVCNGRAMGGTASAGMQLFVPCTDGLRSVTVSSDGQLTMGWQGAATLPPVVGGHTVYSLDGSGTLSAFALDTGAVRTHIALEPVPHFTSLTLSNGHLYVPTFSGIIAVAIN